MATTQPRFSSTLTTLLTMAGLAIGLGNVWRFPYMMGQHGGSAFLLVYVLFMFALAMPALVAEWSLGRSTRSGPVRALQASFGRGPGLVFGAVMLFSVFMATCYYAIVVGNVLYSAGFAAMRGFSGTTFEAYQAGLGSYGIQYLLALVVVYVAIGVTGRGLKRGIELANTILVPLFGLAALYMVVVALSLDGALPKLGEFLRPDFGAVGPSVWFAAMGQACFSIGLSGTLGVMYGSYLRDDARLAPTAAATCGLDLGAAFLGALFVVPAVLVFGLDLAGGPGLLFDTMPRLFAVMPGGRGLAPLFLLGWALVALLTLVAAVDTLSGALAELTPRRLGRRQWRWITGAAATGVIAPIAWHPHWIGTLDLVFGSGMFMTGALLAVLATGWGLDRTTLGTQLGRGMAGRLLSTWIRWVVPVALAAILAGFLFTH